MGTLRKSGEYARVFALHERIKGELSEYLGSTRRFKYSSGLYRYYPELVCLFFFLVCWSSEVFLLGPRIVVYQRLSCKLS